MVCDVQMQAMMAGLFCLITNPYFFGAMCLHTPFCQAGLSLPAEIVANSIEATWASVHWIMSQVYAFPNPRADLSINCSNSQEMRTFAWESLLTDPGDFTTAFKELLKCLGG